MLALTHFLEQVLVVADQFSQLHALFVFCHFESSLNDLVAVHVLHEVDEFRLVKVENCVHDASVVFLAFL